jgi:hypothetical protein
MKHDPEIRDELIELNRKTRRKNKTPLDNHEVVIIVVALAALTISLLSGKLSEDNFGSLMGAFIGYTFGRIFNGWQGKE